MPRVKPIIRWPGGKTRLLDRILPRIPKHTCYVEPFMGGVAVLLAKRASEVEVVNDLNGDLVALYRNVQYHLPALLAEMDWMLNSRKNLREFITQPGLTEIQRAARWFVRNKVSFGANMQSYGVWKSRRPPAVCDENTQELLRRFHDRMAHVVVENLPYDHCMRTYDSPGTFFFVDPPYLHAKPKTYKGWNEEQMTGLRDQLAGLKGKWLLTVDDSRFNRQLFHGCRMKSVTHRNGCVNHANLPSANFSELIISPS